MATTSSIESSAVADLVELLCLRGRQHEQNGYTFLENGEDNAVHLSFGELELQAKAIAAQLQWLEQSRGQALLLYPPGLEFIAGFFGCIAAGVVAIPAYPPDPARLDRTLQRLRNIANDSGAHVVLTTHAVLEVAEAFFPRAPELARLRWIATDAITPSLASDWRPPNVTPATVAMLQYTSGSTGAPKGVMVTHANLLANQEMMRRAFGQSADTTVVGWLPLYHDMGLIGNVLSPLYVGSRCVLMSPISFLQRPLRWLRAISRYRAHTSGAPNFAYELCARKATPADLEQLDLSSWCVAFNGAEPIRKDSLDHFADTFGRCGFAREAFYPCYGLAEATLFVAGGAREEAPTIRWFQSADLEQGRVLPAGGEGPDCRALVSCGHSWMGQELRVVDPESRQECLEAQTGELWVRGSAVAAGYWRQLEATQAAFQARLAPTDEGPFLRTGDLGFLSDGELYVTGRLKDLIIIHGRNLHPQDIERSAEAAHPAVRPGGCIACSAELGEEERLILLAEVHVPGGIPDFDGIITAMLDRVAEEHEIAVYAVCLVAPGSLPKTSSGKLQRGAARDAFLIQELEPLAEWTDPTALSSGGAAGQDVAAYRALWGPFTRLDGRHTRYRFDLEKEVRWEQLDAPGAYFGDSYLEQYGGLYVTALQSEPEALALYQWALAMVVCEEFVLFEGKVVDFLTTERTALGPTRSAILLEEEERKHVAMFERYSAHLSSRHPALYNRVRRTVRDGFSSAWWSGLEAADFPNDRSYHYLTWLLFLYVEEYTIFVADRLAEEQTSVQPAWLSTHLAHRREELQHVVTDVGHLEASAMSAEERRQWGQIFLALTALDYPRMVGLEAAWQACTEAYPALRIYSSSIEVLAHDRAVQREALLRMLRAPGNFSRTRKELYTALAEFDARAASPEREHQEARGTGGAVHAGDEAGPTSASVFPDHVRFAEWFPQGLSERLRGVIDEALGTTVEERAPVRKAAAMDQKAVRAWLIGWIARELRIEPHRVDPGVPFARYGLGSVLAVQMAFDLGNWFGVPVESTAAWTYPNIASLAAHVAPSLPHDGPPVTVEPNGNVPPTGAAAGTTAPSAPAPGLDDLSEAELADLLAEELGRASTD